MDRIVILQPYLDQAMAIAKYLKKFSSRYYVVGGWEEGSLKPKRLPYYDEVVLLPGSGDHSAMNGDTVVPTGARSTYREIAQNGPLDLGSVTFDKSSLVVFDKPKTLGIVSGIGVPTPETYYDIDDIPGYPVFYKQDFEIGGGARGILRNKAGCGAIPQDTGLIYQEVIDSSSTYCVAFLARRGSMVTSFIHKELMSHPRVGGSGVVVTTIDEPRLIEYAERILRKLKFSGWGLIEFKHCPKRDDYVFMEVNAKFWASIELAFMNNAAFLKELFGIGYTGPRRPDAIFMDRLAEYGIREYIKTLMKYRSFYRLHTLRSIPRLPLGSLRVSRDMLRANINEYL